MADAKRPRGRPRTPAEQKAREIKTTLEPKLYAAWKADGRAINAILREVLLTD